MKAITFMPFSVSWLYVICKQRLFFKNNLVLCSIHIKFILSSVGETFEPLGTIHMEMQIANLGVFGPKSSPRCLKRLDIISKYFHILKKKDFF